MYDVTIPVLDAPVVGSATPAKDDPAVLLALHRTVLETIRSTIERYAHPAVYRATNSPPCWTTI